MRRRIVYSGETNEYIGKNTDIPCYLLTSVSQLVYTTDYFFDKTVTNEGTATITKYDNYVEFSEGTVFGIKVYQGANLVNEIPCIESNENVPYVHCIITGERFFLHGTKIINYQNTYFEPLKYGYQWVNYNTNNEIIVPFKTDKTKIY